MDDSSHDSDICESSRNVKSMLIKSRTSQEELDDYAYKRRLGDLIFDANFECGNLGYVENIDRYEYDLMVRPDVCQAKHRMWFNFTVSNQRQNQWGKKCAVLTFVNLSENLKLFHEGYCPVIRSRKHPNWVSLNEEQVFYYRSQNHGNRFVLSLVIRFSTQEDEHQLALFYPYSHHNLSDFIDRWLVELKRLEVRSNQQVAAGNKRAVQHRRGLVVPLSRSPEPRGLKPKPRSDDDQQQQQLRTRSSLETRRSADQDAASNYLPRPSVDKIAESLLLKPIYCVTIGGDTDESRLSLPKVVIICRGSPGNMDSLCSFVCQGLIDYLLSDSLVAGAARDSIHFTIFPMLEPDSICLGNSRSGMSAAHRSSNNHEKVRETLVNILSAAAAGEQRKILLELGADLELLGCRILGSHFDDSLRMERHLLLPKVMSKFVESFYLEACQFSSPAHDESEPHMASRFHSLVEDFPGLDHYQFDVSPFGAFERSLKEREYIKYDQVSYLKIGKALVYSLVETLRPGRQDHVASILYKISKLKPDNELVLNVAKLHT